MSASRRYDVVVLGFGAEPLLEACLDALAADSEEGSGLLLVDNGVHDLASRRARFPDRVRVVGDGVNTGFAGGCNLGAESSTADVLVFVNSDAVVRRGALQALVEAAARPEAGLVCGCLRLAAEPETVNSVGNPVHFLGITWAGHHGEPASAHSRPGPVASITGGFFAVRRDVWQRLDGFDPVYFVYHEDVDLSLRAHLLGLGVHYVPTAVADHHYEFSRSPQKMYLLERNRLITVFTDYPSALLRAVVPAMLLLEPLLLALAARQGWLLQAIRARRWALTHAAQLRSRRRRVQGGETVGASAMAGLLTARLAPPMVSSPPGMALLNWCLAAYWRGARLLIGHGARP